MWATMGLKASTRWHKKKLNPFLKKDLIEQAVLFISMLTSQSINHSTIT
jgi:hypothetical protein